MGYKIKTLDKFSEGDSELYTDISKLTESINDIYPKYDKWLFNKFFPEMKTGKRKIVAAYGENKSLIGVALLKDTDEEKKICCLFVREDCRNKGVAGNLIKESCKALKTDAPLISVSDRSLPQLQCLLDKYGFKFSYKKKGAYQQENTENYFNNKATEMLKKDILAPLFLRAKKGSQQK